MTISSPHTWLMMAFMVVLPSLIISSAQLQADQSELGKSVAVSASSSVSFASTPIPEYYGIDELTVDTVLSDVAQSVVSIFLDPTQNNKTTDNAAQSTQSESTRCANWLWPEIGFRIPTIWGVQPVIPQDISNNSPPATPKFLGVGLIISPKGFVVADLRMFEGVEPSSRICAKTTNKGTFQARLVMIDELSQLAMLKIDTDDVLPYHAPQY